MTIIVGNDQALPAVFNDPNSTNASAGLFSALLIGILPVLLAGLLSAPAPACPPAPSCPLTTACPVSPTITPCPMTTTCPPPPPPCEPIPVCPEPFIQLSSGGVPIENRCFYFQTDSKVTFRDAIVGCAEIGGHVLNIQSVEEGQAVKDYLFANFPDDGFWAGYTDFIGSIPVIGLSGGPTPVPSFGPIDTATNAQECLVLQLDANDDGDNAFETCSNDNYYICDMDLTTQKCACPP